MGINSIKWTAKTVKVILLIFMTYICINCGDSYTKILPAVGHSYGAWIVDKKTELFSAGSEYSVCKNNISEAEYRSIPSLVTLQMNIQRPYCRRK